MSFDVWRFEHFSETLTGLALMRGVCDRNPNGRRFWAPLADNAGGRKEFLRRLALLLESDDSALRSDDRTRALIAYGARLQSESDAMVLAAGGAS